MCRQVGACPSCLKKAVDLKKQCLTFRGKKSMCRYSIKRCSSAKAIHGPLTCHMLNFKCEFAFMGMRVFSNEKSHISILMACNPPQMMHRREPYFPW